MVSCRARDRVCERPVFDQYGDPEPERGMPLAEQPARTTPLERAAAAYIVKMPRAKYGGTKGLPKPETIEEEDARRRMIAYAVVDEAKAHPGGFDPVSATALILTTMYGESGYFDWYVHAGLPTHLGTQDKGQARCLAQIRTWKGNRLLTDEEYAALVGVDYEATRRCAKAALDYYWYHAKRCELQPVEWDTAQQTPKLHVRDARALMVAYATGRCVDFDSLPKKKQGVLGQRVDTWLKMVTEFRAAQGELP